jgi:hypothetical protein
MIKIDQNSDLGSLGLAALLDKGYCGPNYDLSDVKVYFQKMGEMIYVSFWDMNTFIKSGDKYYNEINALIQ